LAAGVLTLMALAVKADMYQNAGNADLPAARDNLGLGTSSAPDFTALKLNGDLFLRHPMTPAADHDTGTNIVLGKNAALNFAPIHSTEYLTAVGYFAAQNIATADHTTAIGAFACAGITDTTGSNNTCLGIDAWRGGTAGQQNVSVGEHALLNATTSGGCTAMGYNAGSNSTDCSSNTAVGTAALGGQSLSPGLTGANNTAYGADALANLAGGAFSNTAIGALSLQSATGGRNTALGYVSGYLVTTGQQNTLLGDSAGYGTGGASNNTHVGYFAGVNATGQNNTTLGWNAGSKLTTGSNNLILGSAAASTTLTTGGYNVVIGADAYVDTPAANTNYSINIGTGGPALWSAVNAYSSTVAQSTFLGQIFLPQVVVGVNTGFACFSAGNQVRLQSSACTISSLRFKDVSGDYQSGGALDTVGKLRPIVFRMKPAEVPDKNYGNTQIGLSAENVAAIEPRCAIYEDDGRTPKSYRQECLIAVLVAAVSEQQREIAALRVGR
jgi:hypothetical protein